MLLLSKLCSLKMQHSAKSKAKDIEDINLLKSSVPCGVYNMLPPKKVLEIIIINYYVIYNIIIIVKNVEYVNWISCEKGLSNTKSEEISDLVSFEMYFLQHIIQGKYFAQFD